MWCGDGGTLIRMKMNQVLDISPGSNPPTLTVEAGATHLNMAKAHIVRNYSGHAEVTAVPFTALFLAP
jgi:hypothetical protein